MWKRKILCEDTNVDMAHHRSSGVTYRLCRFLAGNNNSSFVLRGGRTDSYSSSFKDDLPIASQLISNGGPLPVAGLLPRIISWLLNSTVENETLDFIDRVEDVIISLLSTCCSRCCTVEKSRELMPIVDSDFLYVDSWLLQNCTSESAGDSSRCPIATFNWAG